MSEQIINGPRFMRYMRKLFNSVVEVYRPAVDQDTYGDPIASAYSRVYKDREVRAYIEPGSKEQEIKRTDQTLVTKPYTMYLNGFYPEIQLTDVIRRQTPVGVEWHTIVTVASDDQQVLTMLVTEILTPSDAIQTSD